MEIFSINNLINDDSQPPEPIIGDGLLLPKTLLLITGPSKARKTFLVVNLALSLWCGKSFSIFKINKSHKVLVLSAEGGYYPNRDRIKTMFEQIKSQDNDGKSLEIQGIDFCFDSRIKLDDDDDYDNIKQYLEEHKPDILVIDPFVKFHNMDENSATYMIQILDKLRRLIEDHNIALILVHHLGKQFKNGARGSSTILGEYDACINLGKSDSDDVHKLEFDLRHSFPIPSTHIRFNPETLWFEGKVLTIPEILEEYGAMTKKELVDILLKLKNYKHQSGAYKVIKREVEKGTIQLNTVDNKYYLSNENSNPNEDEELID
jgi:hypothetical protein